MAVSLHDISRRLDIPPDELMKQSLLPFVDREIRLAEWDISDIKHFHNDSEENVEASYPSDDLDEAFRQFPAFVRAQMKEYS